MRKINLLSVIAAAALLSCGSNVGSSLGGYFVAVEKLTLNKESTSICVDEHEQIFAAISPTDATNRRIVWSTSDSSVVSVSNEGIITGLTSGAALITARTSDGGLAAEIRVSVSSTRIPVSGVSFSEDKLLLSAGSSRMLSVTFEPSDATNQNLSWTSSNPAVAIVSAAGMVSATSAGSAEISVTSVDGGKKDICSLTVISAAIPVTGIVLNKSELSLTVGLSETLVASALPLNATNEELIWSSSSPEIAAVSDSGCVVAKSAGTAVITAKTNEGSYSKTCAVTVKGPGLVSVTTVENTSTYRLAGGAEFTIVKTPAVPGSAPQFPMETDDSKSSVVPSPFMIAETETTYAVWKEVYAWATDPSRGNRRYVFSGSGQNGDDYVTASAPYTFPVTEISWRDAIVWCNALTEYCNATNGSAADADCVYFSDAAYSTPIRNSANGDYASSINTASGSFDNPYIKDAAAGFRLPSRIEWEFSARYIGTAVPSNQNVVMKDGVFYTNGNSASGAAADCLDELVTALVAVTYYDRVPNAKSVYEVKSKKKNALGLYDMSGNVEEFCFDWNPNFPGQYRATRGGTSGHTASGVTVGAEGVYFPYNKISTIGFRISRNK